MQIFNILTFNKLQSLKLFPHTLWDVFFLKSLNIKMLQHNDARSRIAVFPSFSEAKQEIYRTFLFSLTYTGSVRLRSEGWTGQIIREIYLGVLAKTRITCTFIEQTGLL